MLIRHLIAAADVDPAGRVTRPEHARHGVVRAGRVAALGGRVDPLTHLNLDFPAHRLDVCVVVHELKPDAPVSQQDGTFQLAIVGRHAFRHLGPVEVGDRRRRWLEALRRGRADAARP